MADLATELTPAELAKIAVDNYTGKGYEGISDCLFALLCDVTRLYVAREEAGLADDLASDEDISLVTLSVLSGTDTLDRILGDVADNIDPDRAYAD